VPTSSGGVGASVGVSGLQRIRGRRSGSGEGAAALTRRGPWWAWRAGRAGAASRSSGTSSSGFVRRLGEPGAGLQRGDLGARLGLGTAVAAALHRRLVRSRSSCTASTRRAWSCMCGSTRRMVPAVRAVRGPGGEAGSGWAWARRSLGAVLCEDGAGGMGWWAARLARGCDGRAGRWAWCTARAWSSARLA
jgi:hypothetical protein